MRLILILLLALFSMQAKALTFSVSGNTITISGGIRVGDAIEFQRFYNKLPEGSVKFVVLNSSGGSIRDGYEIGRTIQRNGLTTLVDVARGKCWSACPLMFAGGKVRILMNANYKDHIDFSRKNGYAFHQAGQGYTNTEIMKTAYRSLGASEAANLVDQATSAQLNYISGATALRLGLATRLTR